MPCPYDRWLIPRRNRLSLRVPLQQAYFDSRARYAFLKRAQIRLAIVIRNHHLGMERLDGVGGFLRGHGIGQVHADKRDVDILERAHLGDAFRITGEINASAAIGEDVAITSALIVIKLAGL